MTKTAGIPPTHNAPSIVPNQQEDKNPQLRHLFVYGTLMRECGSRMGAEQRARLGNESRFIEAATVHGMLFDLGAYPALELSQHEPNDASHRSIVYERETHDGKQGINRSSKSPDTVIGEVVMLHAPPTTWAWLDKYEDAVDPGSTTATGLYRRTQTQARLKSGTRLTVWVYEIATPPARWRRIRNGKWITRNKPLSTRTQPRRVNHP